MTTEETAKSEKLFEDPLGESREPAKNKPRLEMPVRDQVEMVMRSLDSLVPDPHPVRTIWAFVQGLDFDIFHSKIKSLEGGVGRTAKDRRILFALWLYALTEGIGSARHINRLCKRDDVYRWLAGGVSLNYHTIADFRSENEKELDDLFVQCLAVIMKDLHIKVTRFANDGMKVRAKAKRSSFKKEDAIEKHLEAALEHLEHVKQQNDENTDLSKREKAAQKRHAREKVEKCQKALSTLKEIQESKKPSEKDKVKVSISEPEARVMKFGGSSAYHPGYNVQVASDLDTNLILAIEPTQQHNDSRGLKDMIPEIEKNLGELPPVAACDKGYGNHEQLDYADNLGIDLYVPEGSANTPDTTKSTFFKDNSQFHEDTQTITCPAKQEQKLYKGKSGSPGSTEFRFTKNKGCKACPMQKLCFPPHKNGKERGELTYTVRTERNKDLLDKLETRLSNEGAKEILALRFASELVHARIKEFYGLRQLHVQTLGKVRAELLLVAILHNIQRWAALRSQGLANIA